MARCRTVATTLTSSPPRGARYRVARASSVVVAALLPLLPVVTQPAGAMTKQCAADCKQDQRHCRKGMKSVLKAARAACKGTVGRKARRSCKRAAKTSFRDGVRRCRQAFKDVCKACCEEMASGCTAAVCGDGVVKAGVEVCDDGNSVDGDGCDSNCTPTSPGNGIVTDGEECDDGNDIDGDGCDSAFTRTRCGNGIVTAGEECDAGAANSDTAPDRCRTDCTPARCGDGVVDAGEACDSPDRVVCTADCTVCEPQTPEICDGVDNDCDQAVDEDIPDCSPEAVSVTDVLAFATEDQGLFGPGTPVKSDTFLVDDLFSQTFGPVTQGRIERIDQDVPVEILQEVWNRAVATCTGITYTVDPSSYGFDACADFGVRPSESECITGRIGSRTVRVTCCAFGDDYDNGCTLGQTVSRDITVNVDQDLGGGIGSRPTQPLTKSIDVGAVVTYRANVRVGLELEIERNGGSVDMRYGTRAVLQASRASARPGDVVTLTAWHVPDPSAMNMRSLYPSINFIFRYFIRADGQMDADYAHMGADGEQVRVQKTVVRYDSADAAGADALGRLTGDLVSVSAGVAGIRVEAFDGVPYAPEPVQDLAFEFPLTLPLVSMDVTVPFQCPTGGSVIGKVLGKTCPPTFPVSTDLAEFAFRTPQVNTPAFGGFDGGFAGFAPDSPPLLPARSRVDADGSVTNTTPSGWRPLFAGLAAIDPDDPLDINDFTIDEGELSTDFARLDIDVDGLMSCALVGCANPLGVNFQIRSGVDPVLGKPGIVLDAEGNFIDLDIVNFFHIDQSLRFAPGLEAELRFDRPVEVFDETSGEWVVANGWMLPVGAGTFDQLMIRQPAGGVTITPVYGLGGNRFTNTTKWLYTPAIQETLFQIKFDGWLVSLLSGALPAQPNFALLQQTLSPGPIVMDTTFEEPFAFGGFGTATGTPLTIAVP